MKKSKINKTISSCGICLVLVIMIMFGCDKYSKFDITEKPYIDQTSVDLYIGEFAGNRNSIQLKSSPSNLQFKWTSLFPEVASVDQNGLVTAKSEGYTTITVASENDYTEVSVRVREFVPLKGFTLDRTSYAGLIEDVILILVMPEPANATEVFINWTSSNENVAKVYSNGLIMVVGDGTSTITATSAEGITQKVNVFTKQRIPLSENNIPSEGGYLPSVATETIGYSSQAPPYPLRNLFDGNPATFWHGAYQGQGGFNSNFPHWFILDLKRTVIITDMMMQKRQEGTGQNFRSANGFYLYICPDVPVDQSDVNNGYPWVLQGEYAFNSLTNAEQRYTVPNAQARYIKIYYDTKHRDTGGANTYIQMAQFAILGNYIDE